MKRTILSLLVAGTLTTSAFAGTMDSSNKWEEGAKDAWIDGKAEATLLFNGNLNSFDINTDVQNGKVVLTGKVENSVDKKLAEELVANIDGVTDVVSQLTILADHDDADVDNDDMDGEAAMDKLTDAKIATVIKTRLLMDTDISGFDIDVDVKAGNVTLTGTVDSDAERDLAVEIAKNASDVTDVEDNLKVVEPQKAMASE